MSPPTDSHRLPGILCGIVLSFGFVAWKARHAEQFFIASSMSAFIFTQYTESGAWSLVFSMPMWLKSSWFSALPYSDAGTNTFSAFHGNSINDLCKLVPKWPIWLQFLLYVRFVNGQLCCSSSGRMPMVHHLVLLFIFFCCQAVGHVYAWLYCVHGNAHAWYFLILVCLMVVWIANLWWIVVTQAFTGFSVVLMDSWHYSVELVQ